MPRQTITQPETADNAPGLVRLALEMREVRQLHAEHGRKVGLVGVYAREIAKMLLFLDPKRGAWPHPFFGFY